MPQRLNTQRYSIYPISYYVRVSVIVILFISNIILHDFFMSLVLYYRNLGYYVCTKTVVR